MKTCRHFQTWSLELYIELSQNFLGMTGLTRKEENFPESCGRTQWITDIEEISLRFNSLGFDQESWNLKLNKKN